MDSDAAYWDKDPCGILGGGGWGGGGQEWTFTVQSCTFWIWDASSKKWSWIGLPICEPRGQGEFCVRNLNLGIISTFMDLTTWSWIGSSRVGILNHVKPKTLLYNILYAHFTLLVYNLQMLYLQIHYKSKYIVLTLL